MTPEMFDALYVIAKQERLNMAAAVRALLERQLAAQKIHGGTEPAMLDSLPSEQI